ncbi:MAG: hypothetical protein M3P27_04345 [Acidobacteriota bacterium]|nr:hypothetical protein [Acidobacteriota bacterium]
MKITDSKVIVVALFALWFLSLHFYMYVPSGGEHRLGRGIRERGQRLVAAPAVSRARIRR